MAAGMARRYAGGVPPLPPASEPGQRLALRILEKAVEDKAFPGAAFGVLHRGAVLATGAAGRFTFDPASLAVEPSTVFDLASVSKVVATTAMAMILWDRQQLPLDMPLSSLLPGFLGDSRDPRRATVTLRMLLNHHSGLPGYEPLFRRFGTPSALFAATLQLPLLAEPGTVEAYSDPGFILFGKALEILAGEPLESFTHREIFAPLGMATTLYNPRRESWASIPPTEIDSDFRHGVIQGEVHDENCLVLGGVAGHAGLFGSAPDLLRFAEAILAVLRTPGIPGLFSPEAVRLFTSRAGSPVGASHALGWDTPSGDTPSAGKHFSRSSFGHLGYTGTSLWIDPEHDLAVALLTNRTYPSRENRKIQQVRPLFHDAVQGLL